MNTEQTIELPLDGTAGRGTHQHKMAQNCCFSDLCAVVSPAVPLTTAYHPTAPSSQRCCHSQGTTHTVLVLQPMVMGHPDGSGSTFHAEVLWSDNKQLGALFRLWPLPPSLLPETPGSPRTLPAGLWWLGQVTYLWGTGRTKRGKEWSGDGKTEKRKERTV